MHVHHAAASAANVDDFGAKSGGGGGGGNAEGGRCERKRVAGVGAKKVERRSGGGVFAREKRRWALAKVEHVLQGCVVVEECGGKLYLSTDTGGSTAAPSSGRWSNRLRGM
jgi:hypothetical protein